MSIKTCENPDSICGVCSTEYREGEYHCVSLVEQLMRERNASAALHHQVYAEKVTAENALKAAKEEGTAESNRNVELAGRLAAAEMYGAKADERIAELEARAARDRTQLDIADIEINELRSENADIVRRASMEDFMETVGELLIEQAQDLAPVKSPEERLVVVYRELLVLSEDVSGGPVEMWSNDIEVAAKIIAPTVAWILTHGKAA